MFDSQSITRRSVLKFLLISSVVPSIFLSTSCKDDISSPFEREYKTALDKEIAKLENYTALKLPNGNFKIPLDYVELPNNYSWVLIVDYKQGKNLLKTQKVKFIKMDNKFITISGLKNNSILLKNPSIVLNKLKKIDHNTLKMRFIEESEIIKTLRKKGKYEN
jgi:hypothetical protein